MLVIGLIIGFFLGAVCVGVIGLIGLLYRTKDCGKDWWKDE